MKMRSKLFVLQSALALMSAGCDDTSRFSNAPGESYCGAITLGSSFRMGFSPRVQMRVSLDASQIDGPNSPGLLSTYEAAVGDQPEQRFIDNAELRVFPAMAHDPLSRLSLSDAQVRNAVFAVSPADPEAESLIAVLSLRADDRIEVRLLRAGSPPSASGSAPDEKRRPLFGIFMLSKRTGMCGF